MIKFFKQNPKDDAENSPNPFDDSVNRGANKHVYATQQDTLDEQVQSIAAYSRRKADPIELMECDPLSMWNAHSENLSILLPLAAYVFSIPPVSAPVEPLFSRSKHRCSLLQTQMDPETFQRRLMIALNFFLFKVRFMECITKYEKKNETISAQ